MNLRVPGVALVVALLPACTVLGDSLPAIPALPGAVAFSAELQTKLAKALAAQGSGHPPHPRHLRPDGSPQYTNRLVLEASPYLLQHAHNPVNWYPWGDEAFATATKLGGPVLLLCQLPCARCSLPAGRSTEKLRIGTDLRPGARRRAF